MSFIPGAFARRSCPCCKNPWQMDTDEAICVSKCLERDSSTPIGIDPANFDLSVRPQDNFYYFSNGNWIANPENQCPADYSSWNTFIKLRDLNLNRLKDLLDKLELQENDCAIDSETSKVQLFYKTFMNDAKIEAESLPLSFTSIIEICLNKSLDSTTKVATLHRDYCFWPMFKVYSMPDKVDSTFTIASLSQGGLGMPDRDYYFDLDKADKREKYVEYITSVLMMLGDRGVKDYTDGAECARISQCILALETTIAASHMTRTECRDPIATWNKMAPPELNDRARRQQVTWASYLTSSPLAQNKHLIDFNAYFTLMGKPVPEVNVAHVAALVRAAAVPSAAVFPHYLAFHAADSFAPHLPKCFVDAHFLFHEKVCKGTVEQKPRWKLGLAALESALGDALGKLYVKEYFSASAKTKALEIVANVQKAFHKRLEEIQWMSDESKKEAFLKLKRFNVKIGFPDEGAWISYADLAIGDGHLNNVIASRKHLLLQDLARMNSPTDRSRWFMTPQTVNAYYHPLYNEIVFPSAILQAPFFDPDADQAVQYGSFGAVVAHEMSHGYDDQGRKYDSLGNMRDWWTQEDAKAYENRKVVMVTQASQFQVFGIQVNGNLTTGENIADLGGVKLSYRALMALPATATAPPINGLTPAQRFFCAWAQAWRDNSKEEHKKQMVTLDPHGPHEFRCNGPLSNLPEFHDAFNVQEGDPMFKRAEDRVDIW